jgi:hypothetical protein
MEEPLSMISMITESLGITCCIRHLEDSAKIYSKAVITVSLGITRSE